MKLAIEIASCLYGILIYLLAGFAFYLVVCGYSVWWLCIVTIMPLAYPFIFIPLHMWISNNE